LQQLPRFLQFFDVDQYSVNGKRLPVEKSALPANVVIENFDEQQIFAKCLISTRFAQKNIPIRQRDNVLQLCKCISTMQAISECVCTQTTQTWQEEFCDQQIFPPSSLHHHSWFAIQEAQKVLYLFEDCYHELPLQKNRRTQIKTAETLAHLLPTFVDVYFLAVLHDEVVEKSFVYFVCKIQKSKKRKREEEQFQQFRLFCIDVAEKTCFMATRVPVYNVETGTFSVGDGEYLCEAFSSSIEARSLHFIDRYHRR